jgi:biopolymer transport protein ExbB
MNMAEILFVRGGVIGWVLWLLSVVTIAIIVQYFVSIRRVNIIPEDVRARIGRLFEDRQYREAIELTAAEPSFLSYVVRAALGEASRGYSAMERAMEEASEERTAKLLRQVEWLNLIGNVSPMLGLLGTVWGMILAFFEIVQTGTPDPRGLAYGIGIALVTTLLGLGVAIPALAVYGVMRNRIDALSSEAIVAAQELVSNFRPGPKHPETDKPAEKQ